MGKTVNFPPKHDLQMAAPFPGSNVQPVRPANA